MSTLVAENELYRSCRVLFGDELDVDWDFLNYLRHSGLKKAYRLKARQTHPDLWACNQGSAADCDLSDFVSVQLAYENLLAFLNRRDHGPLSTSLYPRNPPSPANCDRFRGNDRRQTGQSATYNRRPGGNTGSNAFHTLHHGPIPKIRMRFGNFLYYSGLVDWTTIVRAVTWQRSQRPRLGELAQRLGWLSETEVLEVLARKKFTERFGATAVRRQLLSEKQLNILLNYQKFLQKKIGAFFLDQQLFTFEQLEELVLKHAEHNKLYGSPWSS